MKPVVLTILDGWGYSHNTIGNSIKSAKTPNLDYLKLKFPFMLLQTSGRAVGLEWGEPGNSEVGHLTLGAGRVILQALSKINKSINDGSFLKNRVFLDAINHVKGSGTKIHLAGLLTSGSVHAHFKHLISLIELFSAQNNIEIYLHLFLDGKDSGLKESTFLIKRLEFYLNNYPAVKIANVIGRDYAMDRNKNWDMTDKAYRLLTAAEGKKINEGELGKELDSLHATGLDDFNIPPLVVNEGSISKGDALIFFNFREDSMRQITQVFGDENFTEFKVKKIPDLYIASMTKYLNDLNIPAAFPNQPITNGLAEVLSTKGKKQLHIAETEKYAHVTYFFNCFHDKPFLNEDDVLLESYKYISSNSAMRTNEICAEVLKNIDLNKYDFILINMANADVLSHKGNLENTIKGVEAIDKAVGNLYKKVLSSDGVLIITSDHGNAEELIYKGSGEVETKHNLNPVPLYFISKEYKREKNEEELDKESAEAKGLLSDVSPTILNLMKIQKPADMTGSSLLQLLINN